MSSIATTPTPIAGAFVLSRRVRADDRGSLERQFDAYELAPLMAGRQIAQVNRTKTVRAGTVRGFHCQLPPAAESKVVTCLAGMVFDVIVDLRADSDSFGRWWGITLDEASPTSVFIPEGCAHGLQALVPDVQMLYLHTAHFDPSCETGISPLDDSVGVEWPLPVTDMSERDRWESRTLEDFRRITW
jgi:dTDP-4-dehydrorhamnose 3,5-epimerase